MLRAASAFGLLLVLPASVLSVEVPGQDTTYEVVKEGNGAAVVGAGDTVTVHATGIVEANAAKGISEYRFWSTKDNDQPFKYVAGRNRVIKGWDGGVLGSKLGEVRQLRIPGHEGYGARGFPAWKIPPDATLLFEIEGLGTSPEGKKEL